MSDISNAQTQARSGISLNTVMRLLAIVLGIMSAVLMARDGFNIRLNDYLDAVAIAYDDLLKDIALVVFDPAIKALFAKFREWFAIDLQLLPHWKHVFVLMWLYFGSHARSFKDRPRVQLSLLLWGGVLAILVGAAVGTVALDNLALTGWPILGVIIFDLGVVIILGARFAHMPFHVWLEMIRLGLPGAFIFAVSTQSANIPFLQELHSPRLALLIFFVLYVAGHKLWLGAWGSEFFRSLASGEFNRRWEEFLHRRATNLAFDMLSVLGGAAFIVWLGHARG